MKFRLFYFFIFIIGIVIVQSCSSTRYVPEGEYWLQNASVNIDTKKISYLDLEPYIQQKHNFKTLALFRLPLFMYNLSGSDTTKWINRVLRSGGEAPVIYDSLKVSQTVDNLTKVMINKGYVHTKVTPETKIKDKKIKVTYRIKAGTPYEIFNYNINIPDSLFENLGTIEAMAQNIRNRSSNDTTLPPLKINNILSRNSLVKKNAIFDLDMLDDERDRVSSMFRRMGYYDFNKEHIGYVADTAYIHKDKVDLELTIYPYSEREQNGSTITNKHRQYVIKDVIFYADYNPLEDGDIEKYIHSEVVNRRNGDFRIYYGKRGIYIKPHVILNSCFINPGSLYNETATTLTYNSFSQLHILKNVNIKYQEIIENDSTKLRCIITCVPDKRQGISVEVEGTNSGGQFGVGSSVGYTHRNLFGGSELFNVKLHAGYEALSARFSDFSKNYFEVGSETSITFPRFMFPFINNDLRKRLQASSQLSANYTFQRRPSYFTRTILSSRFSYIWQNRRNNSIKHTLDLLEVSYVHIPAADLDSAFLNKLTNAARAYSFTDHFILGTGYTYTNSNYNPTFGVRSRNKLSRLYSLRARVESAGNLLSLIANTTGAKQDSLGSKEIFGTKYVQYVLGNVDYSQTIPIDEKNVIAWRLGGGVIYPYGNYKMVPIQKRFFSGGANSVRGWGIRELGPGSFYKPGADFYDQSGEIRFDANIEYRSKVFWKLELAAFLDAGNIWTIKKYEEQEKGNFSINSFYKEIALAWGLGIRLDFEYVLIRFDCGWKLYDPADVPRYKLDGTGQPVFDGYKSKWPVTKPFDFKKNTAWHIAVGYPF